jgi:hypothetical protein
MSTTPNPQHVTYDHIMYSGSPDKLQTPVRDQEEEHNHIYIYMLGNSTTAI